MNSKCPLDVPCLIKVLLVHKKVEVISRAQAQSGCASFEFFADLAFCEARCHDVAEASALAQMGLS